MNAKSRLRRPPSRGALLASVVLASAAFAAPAASIAIDVGFAGSVVDGRFAPITVRIDGLPSAVDAVLIARQTAGNAWRGTARIETSIASGEITNGVLRATVPIHDALSDLEVILKARSGGTIAATTVPLRTSRRDDPFPVYIAPARGPAGTSDPVIDPAGIPSDWWGFDAASSVWIAGPLPHGDWEVIAQWVLAGGSAVVYTGADFFRLDGPIVRQLLGLRDPTPVTWADGTLSLQDPGWPGGTVVIVRDARPLLVHRAIGAGSIWIVTVRPRDLSDAEAAAILGAVTPAIPLRYDAATAGLLAGMRYARPSHAVAIGIVGIGLAALVAGSGIRRTRPWMACGVVIAGAVAASVWSGLYVNMTKPPAIVYHSNTIVSFQDFVGFAVSHDNWYSLDRNTLFLPAGAGAPLVELDHSLATGDHRLEVRDDRPWISLAPGRLRSLRVGTPVRERFQLSISANVASVVGPKSEGSRTAFVVVDGVVHPVEGWSRTDASIELSDGAELESLELGRPDHDGLLRAVADRFPIHAGAWLLVIDDVERTEPVGGLAVAARTVALYVVRGGES